MPGKVTNLVTDIQEVSASWIPLHLDPLDPSGKYTFKFIAESGYLNIITDFNQLTLPDWIEWNGDCKGQNLLLKDVSHRKSSEAEQLEHPLFRRHPVCLSVRMIINTQLCSYPSGLVPMLLSVD
ncbi:hypothetical protein MHYP_G00299470 [Metynnis hypsauchen]